MKKVQKLLISALCVVLGTAGLVACGGGNDGDTAGDKVKVTFFDGTTQLSQVEIDKNSKVAKPETDPTKTGYEFVRWCATPTYSQPFDFNTEIEEDMSVYAGFRSTAEDNHVWYLAGSSSSALFAESGDYKDFTTAKENVDQLPDSVKMTKDATKGNRFTFTADFYEKDKFQILETEHGWGDYQIGYGYMNYEQYTTDSTQPFYSGGGLSGINKTSDIMCGQSGNYTLTLTVDVDGKLTELSYVRNGDAAELEIELTEYFIKGASITGWADLYNDATKMSKVGENYTLEVYLKANDQFMFTTLVTEDGEKKVGTTYIKADALDDASKAYVDGTTSNITAKADGTYKFTYNESTQKLSVTFDAAKAPKQYDYYIDVAKGGTTGWGDYQKDAEGTQLTGSNGKYTIEGVELDADDQFVIRSYVAGTETLGWDNKDVDYNYTYYKVDGTAFAAADAAGGNYNIKVVTAGVYDITFDSYAKMLEIKIHNDSPDIYDIYIKGTNIGTQTGWDHAFAAQYKFTINEAETAYEYTLTIEDGKDVEFGLARYNKGASSGNGDFINATVIGTAGDANSLFTANANNNIICSTAGTYKIVYTIETGKVDFYATPQA